MINLKIQKSHLFVLGLCFLSLLVLVAMPLKVSMYSSSTTNVGITIEEENCVFQVKVYPEKRIPRTGNWSTQLQVDIYSLGNILVASVTGTSNNEGVATFDVCGQGQPLPAGNYNIYIKGYSHLNQQFLNVAAFSFNNPLLDLTTGGVELKAGETSVIYDNKINSLDMATQISAFYSTTDIKNDLNRDGKVNSLDFSNTVFNLYQVGNCSTADPRKLSNPPQIICSN